VNSSQKEMAADVVDKLRQASSRYTTLLDDIRTAASRREVILKDMEEVAKSHPSANLMIGGHALCSIGRSDVVSLLQTSLQQEDNKLAALISKAEAVLQEGS